MGPLQDGCNGGYVVSYVMRPLQDGCNGGCVVSSVMRPLQDGSNCKPKCIGSINLNLVADCIQRTQKGSQFGLAGNKLCAVIPETLVRDPMEVKFIERWNSLKLIESVRTCFRGRSRPGVGTDSVGPGFGLVVAFTSDSLLEVECCASNHILVSSEHITPFPKYGNCFGKWALA
jgi:hypothetical protein